MLQKMRDQTQSLAFKVLVGIIVFVLAIFGFGAFNLFVTGEPEVASVNGDGITQAELAAEVERERARIAGRMGEEFDPSMIDSSRLQGTVLEQLIARRLLTQASNELGVAVSRARVDQLLVSNPAFQADGKFQAEMYRRAVQSMGYTPQGFLDDTAQMMALEQLQTSISSSAFLTQRELNVQAKLLGETRDVAYLPFEADGFREQVTVTDEEVQQRYEENQLAYMTPESVDAAYVVLSRDSLVDDPSIEVNEEDIAAAYQAEKDAAPAGEERRSRHILLSTGDERTLEEAQAELQNLRKRIVDGESFADIAAENSEDPGSAADGGELGFAGRGIFDPAFEEALFALGDAGDVSEPVVTDFGVHLIQLEEIRQDTYPEFEEARAGIERRLREEQADELFAEKLREMDNLAFEQPNDLKGIQSALGLTVETADEVTRDQGPAPFDDSAVREALFADEVLENGYNSAASEFADGRAIVVRVRQRHEPEAIPFEDVAASIRDAMETERAQELAIAGLEAGREKLESGASAAEVARTVSGNWQRFEAVRRNATEVPRTVVQTAFDLPRPAENDKQVGTALLPSGGSALVTVTRVRDGDVQALTEAEVSSMESFLADRLARLEFAGLFETVRADASISRPEL